MSYLAVFKRIVPFLLTFAAGLLIASIFVPITAPNFQRGDRGGRGRYNNRELKRENESLRRENLRMRQEIEEMRREMQESKFSDLRFEVPEIRVDVPPPPPPPRVK